MKIIYCKLVIMTCEIRCLLMFQKNVQVDSGVKLGKNDTIKDNAKVAKSTIKGTYKRRYN